MKKNLLLIILCSITLIGCKNKNIENDLEKTKAKNVLFIVSDDLTKTLGCYGHPVVKTPNIDKLAQRGVLFENAHSNFAVCNPSRSSFLTGIEPEKLGILDNVVALQDVIGDRITMPALFKANGFYTVSIGKVFHRPEAGHNDLNAWDEFYVTETTELGKKGESRNMTNGVLKWCEWKANEGTDEDQQDGLNAKLAVDFIKSGNEKPFFLAVGFHKPHDPFHAPKKYFDMYPLEDCDPPVIPDGWTPPYKHTLPRETEVFNKFTDQDKREFLRSYYACTTFMDAQVGKVITALEETGQLDNTLIFFLGDHGYHLGEQNWWNKVTVYEKGTAAPFIIAGPQVNKKGVNSKAMFEFIDIYPTIAELMELNDIPDYLDGKSFANVVNNHELPFRTEVHALTKRGGFLGKTVKNENWRYTEWDEGKKGTELYNQITDPLEYDNLADNPEYLEVKNKMKLLLK